MFYSTFFATNIQQIH